ncbi:MAG: hypothetical protein HY289_04055, partial [Planctomycetes bacterium]|nr:hypothetical protein [Planctomycetota bacterium]
DPGGNYAIPGAIQDLALAFTDLQEKRNVADYDRRERFARSHILMLIEAARDHVAAFAQLPMSDDKKFFLACLWAWKELTNR